MSAVKRSESRLAEVQAAIRTQKWDAVRQTAGSLHPADIADLIVDLPERDEGVLFRLLPRDVAAQAFSYLPLHHQRSLIDSLSSDEVGEIVRGIAPDDRNRLFDELPAEVTRHLLGALKPEQLKEARALLGYAEGTAGRYMTPSYVAVLPERTAAEALDDIRQKGRSAETLNVIYIVDAAGALVEDIRLGSLVLADPTARVTDIPDPHLVSIRASDKVDEVLRLFRKYDRVALPVTDVNGQMLGIITIDDVLDIAETAATEDIQKMGGSEALDAPYLSVGFWSMVKKRGGWLSALFLGEMLTATAMSYFEGEIAKAVVLALFVPLIISSGGNSGSQATSLIIRSLAHVDSTVRLVVVGEGPLGPTLREVAVAAGVADRVTWAGAIDEAELIDLYAGALGVVFPPFDEDYGYVTLEAFLARKPVVTTTDAGGPLEFVEQAITGLVSEPVAEAIGAAIGRLAADHRFAQSLGDAGYDRARGITWDGVVDRLLGSPAGSGHAVPR